MAYIYVVVGVDYDSDDFDSWEGYTNLGVCSSIDKAKELVQRHGFNLQYDKILIQMFGVDNHYSQEAELRDGEIINRRYKCSKYRWDN